MSLWDDLPDGVRDTGALDALEPLLDSVATPTETEESDADGAWKVYRTSVGDDDPLSLDPATGQFRRAAGTGSTPVEFPDPRVQLELRLHLDAPGGSSDGWVRLIVATPKAIVRLPFLRGARLDAQGQLREDPAHPDVKFHLPAIRIQVEREAAGSVGVEILSADTTGSPTDQLYEFVRMEPPYALVGPQDVVGFAFRSAQLDLSATSGPTGVPSGVFALPTDWQGFYLPEARLFVAPSGLEGLAVSGGVRNLWIGLGEHAGVTGIFEAEVVDRGSDPDVRLRFQTPSGEWIGVPDPVGGADPTTPIELPEQTRLYADAGGGLAPHTYTITVGGTTTSSDRVDVTTPPTGTVTISVAVSDAASHTTTRTISVRRRGTTPTGGTPPSGAQQVSITPTSTGPARIEIVAQSATTATVKLVPEGGSITWTWDGGGTATGPTAQIPVAAGATVSVSATRALPTEIECFMLFDRPRSGSASALRAWALNPANTRTDHAGSRTGWAGGTDFLATTSLARFDEYPAGTTWDVEGFASYEGDDSPSTQQWNRDLSKRRRDALVTIMQERTSIPDTAITAGTFHGHSQARVSTNPPAGASDWWRAVATATVPGGPTQTTTADLHRPTTPAPVPDVDPTPTTPPTPDCFRKLGFRVELRRGTFVRAEVYGEFDIQTAAEQRLAANSSESLPPRTNPSDGISTFLVRLRIAEDRTSWDVTAEFRAKEGDLDGLAKLEAPATGSSTGINILGAVVTLSPLLAAVTPPSPRDAEIVPMLVATGAAVAIGAAGVMETKSIILRGGELFVSDGVVDPDTGLGPNTTQVSILVDVETKFTFDLGFIRVDPNKPVTTRYKAVGVRSSWSSDPQPDGTIEYVPLPVFDPSRGYTLDIPAGSLVATDPLGELLRIFGVGVSRDNPTYLDVEVGIGVDLGIITVDTAKVRIRLDELEPPQLTKLGASIEVPGALHGKGLVEITDSGFKGSFDLTITPVKIRVAAGIAVESRDGVTGVLVGAEVEFPVPILLGSSGLGIFGFMGGTGVNYARDESPGATVPALAWLHDQFRRPLGVMDPGGWTLTPGAHAFAAGMLVGTVEGGFVLHLKGIVLIEVPGPRLLLVMKADVLKLPPVLDSEQSATFLAVLDIDFGRGTITIGIVAEYSIKSLLQIRVPVTAFFDTNDPNDWFVDLGRYDDPVTVKVLDVIDGAGYLMVHGDGITGLPVPIVTSGLTIGVGFHIRAVLMGSKSVGLYLEVAAGFDAVVSFEPFAIGGKIYARGELRLFIISIGASAELTVLVGRQLLPNGSEVDRTYVHGKVCGKVSFFFFSIEGCVELTIGDQPPAILPPPDLVAGVVLISRSPALIEGTAGDRAIDGKLGDAIELDGGSTGGADVPSVPLDAIPVVMFNAPTDEAPGNIVLGGQARGSNGLPGSPWLQKGDHWWRYRVTAVEIVGPLVGEQPATWWTRGLPNDPSHGPALALLDWVPEPTPRAVTYGETLTTTVRERWGRICDRSAAPSPLMWTFVEPVLQPVGPSSTGWRLRGVAWPDADGTIRTSPADAVLEVSEPWRSGDESTDLLHGTAPAVVVGDAVTCDKDLPDKIDSVKAWAQGELDTYSEAALADDVVAAAELAEHLANGIGLGDLAVAQAMQAWSPSNGGHPDDPPDHREPRCDGRILRSPFDDRLEPAGGKPPNAELVARGWDEQGHRPPDRANVVRLACAAGLQELTLLLLVPVEAIEVEMCVLRFFDADGTVIDEQRVGGSSVVSAANPVPSDWTAPGGPWTTAVTHAGRVAARVAGRNQVELCLVAAEVQPGCVAVEIGLERDLLRGDTGPAFYVVAASGLTAAEVQRHDWDDSTTEREREAIETTLTQDPDDHALFVPGTDYTVRVRWQGTSVEQDDQPPATHPVDWTSVDEQTQDFRFTTDGTGDAPTDLTPWLLSSTPGPDETGVLCREPVMIALATQNVGRLFDAYGEELRVVVHGASGKHPSPPTGGGPGAPVAIPVVPGSPTDPGALLTPLLTTQPVMVPWEEAVLELVDGLDCIPSDVDRTHHHVLTIAYDFEPLTEYLLDIRAVPKGSPDDEEGRRVYRLGFRTSRFDTVDELAEIVRTSPIEHSYVAAAGHLAALGDRPSGADLDRAMQQAGLDVPTTPRWPRVDVLWSGGGAGGTPQPVAVVVESSETLWRERPMPTKIVDTQSTETPKPSWWTAQPTPWLEPRVSTTPPSPGEPPRTTVDRVIRAPGDCRAIVLLAPNQRGTELLVDLVVPTNELYGEPERREPLFGVSLHAAPWEEEN